MGGLTPVSEPAGVARIRQALDEQKKGNSLSLTKLQHAVVRGPSADATELLVGLTHFAYLLHNHAGANSLRQLMKSALDINFAAFDDLIEEPAASAALVLAYRNFVLNLVSANVTFVEPALTSFAKRSFSLSNQLRQPVMDCVLSMIPIILSMHPQATDVLARVLNEKHPHQVKSGLEIATYMRSILELAEVCDNTFLRYSVLFTVVEKLLAVDALVPDDYIQPSAPQEKDPIVADDIIPKKPAVTFSVPEGSMLCPAAEKMDLVLHEVALYLKNASEVHSASFSANYVEPIYRAFERFVLPQVGSRFVPYVLFFAASLAGETVCEDVAERLRQSFFDVSLHGENRSVYLRFSAAMVTRSTAISPRYCLGWLKSLCQWLNRYIDSFSESYLNPASEADPRAHVLFYTALSYVLKTVVLRPDALDPSFTFQRDALAQMRLLRVLVSPLSPTLFIEQAVVSQFCDMCFKVCGSDWKEKIRESELRYSSKLTLSPVPDIECLAPLTHFKSSALLEGCHRMSMSEDAVNQPSGIFVPPVGTNVQSVPSVVPMSVLSK